jgi:hypothetical protein
MFKQHNEAKHFPPLCIYWRVILRNLLNMAKNICIYLKFCFQEMYASGAVLEYWAADPKDVGSPPACAL